jgi:thiamine biosynthesis protein ThiI
MHTDRILIHYAEVALKGRNRRDFELALKRNIKHRLRGAGLAWEVHRGRSRITVRVPADAGEAVDRAIELLREVAGIASIAPAVHIPGEVLRREPRNPDLQCLEDTVVAMARRSWRPNATFALRVNRGDKGFPMKSDALARHLGAAVIRETDWGSVNLNRPDQSFHVDIYPEGAYVYAQRHKGMGGLPVHSGGHVLSLLSGGIDSPVASWMMAKRGCRVDFLHMTATHLAANHAQENLVARIARSLSRYTLRSRLYLVPYTHFDMALIGHEQSGHEMILFRRFMARIGQRLAAERGAKALVAGDSLGQVASQTLENMVSVSQACDLPILRPLIGLDKQEIVDRARRIGTFELSTEPYKDCCALLSRNPRTKSRHRNLEAMERRVIPDYEALVDATLAEMVVLDFDAGEVIERDAETAVAE